MQVDGYDSAARGRFHPFRAAPGLLPRGFGRIGQASTVCMVMPPLTWLIQANMRDQAFRSQLAAELDLLGEEWHEVELIPFSDQIPALPFRASDRLIICYGPSFVPRIALHTSWTPGIF